ncbi:MAG TPA: transcriptional regulator, partial [Hyphomicrobiaceae bacterium]|nr:transcriptional regulator [Hyphomicrobiaceae bacterium]
AQVLGVSVQFFYDDAPLPEARALEAEASAAADGHQGPADEHSIVEFLRSRDGLELNRAFVRISDIKARRAIVDLVRSLANDA